MFSESKMVFSFYNDYTADFTFGNNYATFIISSGNVSRSANGTYIQTAYPASFSRVDCSVYPTNLEEVTDLEASTNQEGVTVSKNQLGSYVQLQVSGVNTSSPLEVYLGNVLLLYAYPEQ